MDNILGYFVYEIEDMESLKSLIINDIKLEQNDIISNILVELDKTSHEYKAIQIIIKTHQLPNNEILFEHGYLPIKINTKKWFVKHQKRL